MTAGTNGHDIFLSDAHRKELKEESAISHEVVSARGYRTIDKPGSADHRDQDKLLKYGFPDWVVGSNGRYPLLYIPIYGAFGEKVSAQVKPRTAVQFNGKSNKYCTPKGQALRLDVHPFNRNKIVDPTEELWINEGIKKADSLTSRGVCTVALIGGVYGFRNQHGTLGDWENIIVKGRVCYLCWDADARTKAQVRSSMKRAGRFLKAKGAKTVYYLIVPSEYNGVPTKGVDDYFAAGGTLEEIKQHRTTKPPTDVRVASEFTDAKVAEIIAAEVMDDAYIWVKGLEWLGWNGRVWHPVSDVEVTESIRQYVLDRCAQAAQEVKEHDGNAEAIKGWMRYQSRNALNNTRELARGMVERQAIDLDAEPEWLNTPTGILDLTTGAILPHDPAHLMTKITQGSYREGFAHPDWETALEALPKDEREYMRYRIGQAITGYETPDAVLTILQGIGENGKSLLTTDGPVLALGDYAYMANSKLLLHGSGSSHSEERASLRGKRLVIVEELPEGRSLDVTAMKQVTGVGLVNARHVYGKEFTFRASHSLFVTTNYVPVVSEVDWGTWRRLQLIRFPFRFCKRKDDMVTEMDRLGDLHLKDRIKANETGQFDAIVTWAVEGAIDYAVLGPETGREPTTQIETDTDAWRAEADRILGFWREHLVADLDVAMTTRELRDAFNDWMRENGHTSWALETFVPRFVQHSETAKHGVEQKRIRTNGRDIRRYTSKEKDRFGSYDFTNYHSVLKDREHCFLGVRLRTASDKEE